MLLRILVLCSALILLFAASQATQAQELAAGTDEELGWRRAISLARYLENHGRYKEAESKLNEALREARGFGSSDKRMAITWNNMAHLHQVTGRWEEAKREYNTALRIWLQLPRENHNFLMGNALNLVGLYLESAQFDQAGKLWKQVVAPGMSDVDPDTPEYPRMKGLLGSLRLSRRRAEEADELFTSAIEAWEKKGDEAAAEIGMALKTRGLARAQLRRFSSASADVDRAIIMYEKKYGTEHPMLVRFLDDAAGVYSEAKNKEAAERCYQRALGLVAVYFGHGHPFEAAILTHYADFLRETGRKQEAKQRLAEARRSRSARAGDRTTVDVNELSGFADSLVRTP